nr:hypothetical protein [Tanacetum cinerariifolium]
MIRTQRGRTSGVPLRATLIQFALLADVDTKESVVELQVHVSSVVNLAIYRKTAGRTPLRARLVRLTRSQVLVRKVKRLVKGYDWKQGLGTKNENIAKMMISGLTLSSLLII